MNTTVEQFLDFLCRTCLEEIVEKNSDAANAKPGHYIFDTIEATASLLIAELISTIVPQIEVELNDELSKKICHKCYEELLSIYRFQQTCIQTDQDMRQLIGNLNLETKKELSVHESDSGEPEEKVIDSASMGMLPKATQSNDLDQLEYVELKLGNYNNSETDANISVINEPCNDDDSNDEYNDNDIVPLSTITIKNEEEHETLPSSAHLKRHKKLDDTKHKKKCYECNSCDRAFNDLKSLDKHRLKHDNKANKYSCDVCNKILNSQVILNRHKRFTHSDGKYACEFCDKVFKYPGVLKTHIFTHTGEKPYSCPDCSNSFTTSTHLKNHRLRHHTANRYECPHCPMKFKHYHDMYRHKRIHDKTKPHVCDICNDRFSKALELKRHKTSHTGDEPFKCDYCDKRFVNQSHLRRHTHIHTGEKPYKCNYCDRDFNSSHSHISHLRTHLGENVHRCALCPRAFRLASERRLHFARHKNDDEETLKRNKQALIDEEAKLTLKFLKKKGHQLTVEQSQLEVEPNITAMPLDV